MVVREATGTDVSREQNPAAVYVKVLPLLRALKPEEVLPNRLDVVSAVAKVLGAIGAIRAQRDAILQMIPSFDVLNIDNLEDYALAALHAHSLYRSATEDPPELPALVAEGYALREVLSADIACLVRRRLVNPKSLRKLSRRHGPKDLIEDLQIQVSVVREAWPRIQGVSAITADDLLRASKVATRISRLMKRRQVASKSFAERADLRARALTLLCRSYNQVRRAICVVRWDKRDLESIAPSLYAGKKRDSEEHKTMPAGSNPFME